ncbi:MAG: Fic family protein [Flavobacteriales bacterium]|nr:Fic family protein [Flavobacteriales bacterium]
MALSPAFYTDPAAMEPLHPEDPSGELEELATTLIVESAKLSSALHPRTRAAIAELVRPMNSYYSNRIEGHDTHPIDIDRALRNDYSQDKKKRDLQQEAVAHINVSAALRRGELSGDHLDPSSTAFIKGLHKAFYGHLPDSFLTVTTKEGGTRQVVPGEFRTEEVEVARHVAPASARIPLFMERFAEVYDHRGKLNTSRTERVIAIAAAHHRLAWIHPFLDGNGRVVRLYSDACFMAEDLDAGGIWSIARGLARSHDTYYEHLANADGPRRGERDGRGNLSMAGLVDFCRYFLRTAIDQVTFMHGSLALGTLERRLDAYVHRMAADGRMKPEATYILKELFLRGRLTRPDAERITGTSEKTLKKTTDELIALELMTARKEGITVVFEPRYPLHLSPYILPSLYPEGKEAELMAGL